MRTRTRTRSAALASGFAALALFASACGSDGGSDKDGDTSKDTGNNAGQASDDAAKHRKCLRDNGMDVPDPKPGEDGRGMTISGDGMSKEKMEKAMKACAGKGGPGSAGAGITQADKDKMLKHAQCMRKNGFNMPDPKFGGDGGSVSAQRMPKGPEMKKFEKANKACESIVR
ncbi:hypothetical protein ABCR94_01145 [Streptomyces sp. 21So2-11]|uniref:hypothetical protein n=1 Tax=Streptomyces sp. 21So2-11 TaxID=3144408 RepID=UPI003219DB70